MPRGKKHKEFPNRHQATDGYFFISVKNRPTVAIIQTLPYFSNQHKHVALILQIVRVRLILINTSRNSVNKPYLLPPKSTQSSQENRQRPHSFSSERTSFRYKPKPRIKSDFFFLYLSALIFYKTPKVHRKKAYNHKS